ncbi:Methyl-CpG-binding domain-containing protein 9 [Vitis vinifera]|uniref:Methyl-CpG-binding domain-containing protein 9 n=1 Tax=Vitis vinifera TaxID=29760 RepID=A0A438JIC8_VITVI|nr:Methyl-CpG-binding domain-containing protein 9 [Vitis vinifera]
MVQATIMLEDMIKTEYLMNGWWYWSSLSAAAKTSTVSSLALRIYSLDAAIAYEKISSNLDLTDSPKPSSKPDPKPVPNLDTMEKSKLGRKQNKRRKESEVCIGSYGYQRLSWKSKDVAAAAASLCVCWKQRQNGYQNASNFGLISAAAFGSLAWKGKDGHTFSHKEQDVNTI